MSTSKNRSNWSSAKLDGMKKGQKPKPRKSKTLKDAHQVVLLSDERKTVRDPSHVQDSDVRSLSREVLSLMDQTELKGPPLLRGSPLLHATDAKYIALISTEGSELLRNAYRKMLGTRNWKFRLGTVFAMSSSGAGLVNSVISNTALGSVGEFSSFSSLFNEFFVLGFHAHWEPVSMYNGPVGYSAISNVSSVPIGVAELQHSQPSYSALSTMMESPSTLACNTGRPFTYIWGNVEKPSGGMSNPVASSSPTQGWSTVGNSASYQGSIQIIGSTAPPLPNSAILGTFFVHWDVLFRVRE